MIKWSIVPYVSKDDWCNLWLLISSISVYCINIYALSVPFSTAPISSSKYKRMQFNIIVVILISSIKAISAYSWFQTVVSNLQLLLNICWKESLKTCKCLWRAPPLSSFSFKVEKHRLYRTPGSKMRGIV